MRKHETSSRLEKIRLEAEKAQAYLQHTDDIPLTENFRVEAFPQNPYQVLITDATFMGGGNRMGMLAEPNPYVPKQSAKNLLACMKAKLEMAQTYPSQEIQDSLLSDYHQLIRQHGSSAMDKDQREKVLANVFGDNFFRNSGEFKMRES